MKVQNLAILLLLVAVTHAKYFDKLWFQDGGIDISRCEVEGEYYCACEKYFEGISGQGCSEGRHNCDHSKTCYMNHPWHACCLNKAAEAEDEVVEAKEHEPQKEENSDIDISRCEVEGEYYCKCEKYFEGIPGQGCSEGRHNCDGSKTCYMNHPWHACCLKEE